MAVIEKSGLMKYKDEAGNIYLMYPITNTDNVDGLDDMINGAKVFWATYGTTTRAEILAAHNAGKIVCVKNGTGVFTLCLLPDNGPYTFTVNTVLSGVSEGSVPFTNVIWLETDDVWTSYQSLKLATQIYVNTAIQSAIQNTWEASY